MSKAKSPTLELPDIDEAELEGDAARRVWVALPALADLRWAENPKLHDLGAMMQSLRAYGFRDPPAFDANLTSITGSQGALVYGNGRVEALVEMFNQGEPPPRGVRIHRETGVWYAPVEVGLDARDAFEAAAFGIDHNSLTLAGGEVGVTEHAAIFDQARLVAVLQDAHQHGRSAVVFDDEGLQALINGLAMGNGSGASEDGGGQVDKADELQQIWQVSRGDLWIISGAHGGEHRLLCGDSTNAEDVARVMDGQRALLMNTDPPYGDDWIEKAQAMHERGYGHSRAVRSAAIPSDNLKGDEMAAFLKSWLSMAVEYALNAPASVYVWHGAKRRLFEQALIDVGCHVHQAVVWLKPSFVIGRLNYHPQCEWALHGWLQGDGRGVFYGERNQSDVWTVERENQGLHPTQKPVELFIRPMRNHLRMNEIAYEPFAGSGSQYVAGVKTGNRVYGLELQERYCAVTLQRLADLGLVPERIS